MASQCYDMLVICDEIIPHTIDEHYDSQWPGAINSLWPSDAYMRE